MEVLLVAGLLILNVGISWCNAKAAGMIWLETKAQGGFMRLVAWSAAIQSAFGFTMAFAVLLAGLAFGLHLFNAGAASAMMDLTYLLVVVPLLGSGLIITIHSYIVAWRERSLMSMGTTAWNTFATIHNTADAVDGLGEAFSDVMGFVKADDEEEGGAAIALILILLAFSLGCGVVLTYAIARSNLHKLSEPPLKATHS